MQNCKIEQVSSVSYLTLSRTSPAARGTCFENHCARASASKEQTPGLGLGLEHMTRSYGPWPLGVGDRSCCPLTP